MKTEVAGDGGQMLDRFIVHLVKLWWRYDGLLVRFERFLKRWQQSASVGYEDPTEPLPVRRDYHAGYGNTHESGGSRIWIAAAIVIAAVLISCALFSLNGAIASLEDRVRALDPEHTQGIKE